MQNSRVWTRVFAALIASVALSLSLAAPATAAARTWSDSKCDVSGYDWFADKHKHGRCAGIDLYSVAVSNSRNAVSVTVNYDYMPWYTKKNEKQRVWLNTDKDARPEYLITAYRPNYQGTRARISRVNGWRNEGRAIACGGASIKLNPSADKLAASVPRSCLRRFGALRASVRSFDRYDGGKSWRKDTFPGGHNWTPRVGRR